MEPNRPKVLVVEDEALVREALAAHLEDAGFAVLEADTGETAFDLLRIWQDRIEEFRRSHPLRPVVYATGFREEWPQQVPGSIFLRKPYHPSQVVAAFRRLVHDIEAIAAP